MGADMFVFVAKACALGIRCWRFHLCKTLELVSERLLRRLGHRQLKGQNELRAYGLVCWKFPPRISSLNIGVSVCKQVAHVWYRLKMWLWIQGR